MTVGFKGISSSSKTGLTISSSLEKPLVIGVGLKCLTFFVFKISQFSHWKKSEEGEEFFSSVVCCAFWFCLRIRRGHMKHFFFNIFGNKTNVFDKFQAQISYTHISFSEKYHCCILQQELLRMRRLLLLVEMEDTFSLSLSYVKICRDLPIFLLRLLCWYVILWCCVCLLKEILGYLQTHVTVV